MYRLLSLQKDLKAWSIRSQICNITYSKWFRFKIEPSLIQICKIIVSYQGTIKIREETLNSGKQLTNSGIQWLTMNYSALISYMIRNGTQSMAEWFKMGMTVVVVTDAVIQRILLALKFRIIWNIIKEINNKTEQRNKPTQIWNIINNWTKHFNKILELLRRKIDWIKLLAFHLFSIPFKILIVRWNSIKTSKK